MAGFYDLYRMAMGWWSSEVITTPGIPSEWITICNTIEPITLTNHERCTLANDLGTIMVENNGTHTIETGNTIIVMNMQRTN